MGRPLLALAALFGLGSAVIDRQAGQGEAWLLLTLAALLLLAALGCAASRGAVLALAGATVAAGAAAGAVEGLQFESMGLRDLLRDVSAGGEEAPPWRMVGTVRGDAQVRLGRLDLVLDVESAERLGRKVRTRGRVRVEIGGDAGQRRWLDGERVALWAKLRPTRRADGVREGVAAYGFCKSGRLVALQETSGSQWHPRRVASRLRQEGREALARDLPPGPERGLVLAMTLGDRSEIDEATAEAFKASGTYHVLALSGAQVALLAVFVVGALRLLLAPPWLQAIVTTFTISCYALLVGGDVPVVRAVLMAAAVLLGRALEVDADASNLLGLAAVLLIAHRPACVFDVGFQLSFGATLGILLLVPPLTDGVRKLPLRVELAVAASLAAQAVLSPILAASFHRIAPAALVLNVVAVPLSSAVLLSGLGLLGAQAFGTGAAGAAGIVAWAAAHALRITGDLGPLSSWLDLRVATPSCVLLLAQLCGIAWLRRGRRAAGVTVLCGSQALMVVGPLRAEADGRLHLTMVDVGQGESLLLRSGSGRAALIDAGGSADPRFDPGERRVAPEIWGHGLRRLDMLAVTHAHPDHTGGVPFILKAFRVAEIWEGLAAPRDAAWRQLNAALTAERVGRRCLVAGMSISWEGVRICVLGPVPPRWVARRVRNEDSLLLALSYGEVRMLLTGDVAGEAERTAGAAPAFIMKVPHHGSRMSSSADLVSVVHPRVALISVGARNAYGDPRPEVLERYLRAGAFVLRTDQDGTIDVATDGRAVWVRTSGEAIERRIR